MRLWFRIMAGTLQEHLWAVDTRQNTMPRPRGFARITIRDAKAITTRARMDCRPPELTEGMGRAITGCTTTRPTTIAIARATYSRGVRPAPGGHAQRADWDRLARKLGTMPAFLEYALDLLPLRRYPARAYRGKMAESRRRIGRRDPDDIDVLALALRLQAPLWSNDRDFEGTGVEQMTTTDVLTAFFRPSARPR